MPLLKSVNNSEPLLFMNWIITLGGGELHRVEGYRPSRLPGGPPTQHGSSPVITSISSDENLVFSQVLMVDDSKALATHHKSLDSCKGIFMFLSPFWEAFIVLFACKGCEDGGVFCQILEVYSNVPDYTQEGSHISGSLGVGPF